MYAVHGRDDINDKEQKRIEVIIIHDLNTYIFTQKNPEKSCQFNVY